MTKYQSLESLERRVVGALMNWLPLPLGTEDRQLPHKEGIVVVDRIPRTR